MNVTIDTLMKMRDKARSLAHDNDLIGVVVHESDALARSLYRHYLPRPEAAKTLFGFPVETRVTLPSGYVAFVHRETQKLLASIRFDPDGVPIFPREWRADRHAWVQLIKKNYRRNKRRRRNQR